MPKDTEKEKKLRNKKMQEGYKIATLVPLETLENCKDALYICKDISELMDESMSSDVGSGALMANAGANAAAYNVRINLKSITDKSFSSKTIKKLEASLKDCKNTLKTILDNVEKCL